MRIITGTLKGRKIPIPDTGELRPTADRTKEAIFSIIAARRFFEGCHVLDLFAGSGNLGFEALSRGVESVHFVEQNPNHSELIRSLSRKFGLEDRVTIHTLSTEAFLGKPPRPYDLIFCDPPYDYPQMEQMVETILSKDWLRPEGWFILEHDKRHDFRRHPACFHSKPYGRTTVSMFELSGV